MVYNTHVRVPTHWYAVSDATAFYEMSESQCTDGGAAVDHSSLHNALLSHILRPVGDTLGCDHAECMLHSKGAKRSYEKKPHQTRFPRSLELDRGESRRKAPTSVEFVLNLGDVKYELISIVLQNTCHYRALVLLDGKWWDYDDLHKNTQDFPGAIKHKPLLVEVGGPEHVRAKLRKLRQLMPASRRFHPRIWRYSRTSEMRGSFAGWSDALSVNDFNNTCFNDPSIHGAGTPTLKGGTW